MSEMSDVDFLPWFAEILQLFEEAGRDAPEIEVMERRCAGGPEIFVTDGDVYFQLFLYCHLPGDKAVFGIRRSPFKLQIGPYETLSHAMSTIKEALCRLNSTPSSSPPAKRRRSKRKS
jgi:hypothetical protein